MKNPFAKVFLIVGPLGCLGFVVGIIVLVILFYVEEDWRAAHEWAALKTKWEAKGVSFDRHAYAPESIPDDQNLAAIPLFEQESPPDGSPDKQPLKLRKAFRLDQSGYEPPQTGSWMKGEPLNMAKIQETIGKLYAKAFKDSTPPANTLAQLEALHPVLAELREASKTHPLCRFDEDYEIALPAGRPLMLLTSQLAVSKMLNLHANLALMDHQPDLALADLKVNFNLMSGMRRDPSLIAGLVGIAMNAIATSAIYHGLVLHAWNNAQLVDLESELRSIDFLQNHQSVMRGEAVAEIAPTIDFTKKNMPKYLTGMTSDEPFIMNKTIVSLWPSGWLDFNKVSAVNMVLSNSAVADPKSHRVFTDQSDDLQNKYKEFEERGDVEAPWNFLYLIMCGPVLNSTVKFAQAQVWVDETRIACALERYRLAHNAYPSSLDALAPTFIAEVPHDIITGDPYHYQLHPDGTFLLYSVGWNQTDEDGQIVYKKDAPTQIDYAQGDWPWPVPR